MESHAKLLLIFLQHLAAVDSNTLDSGHLSEAAKEKTIQQCKDMAATYLLYLRAFLRSFKPTAGRNSMTEKDFANIVHYGSIISSVQKRLFLKQDPSYLE